MDLGLSRFDFMLLGVFALATSVSARNAHAYPFYFDVQGGAGQYMNTESLFGSGTSGTTPFGLGAAFGFFYTPLELKNGLDIQFGFQSMYVTTTQDLSAGYTQQYSTLALYPEIRLQLWMMYASVGVSPFIWRRSENFPGAENFSLAPKTLSYMTEAGILYAATPKFSMGGGLTIQFFSTNSVINLQPAMSIHFVMRFYFSIFNIGTDGPAAKNSIEFNSWRYIGK